jgi:hypothetical protein
MPTLYNQSPQRLSWRHAGSVFSVDPFGEIELEPSEALEAQVRGFPLAKTPAPSKEVVESAPVDVPEVKRGPGRPRKQRQEDEDPSYGSDFDLRPRA